MRNFTSLSEIEAANRAAGYHWFEASSMRFFRSRVGSTVYYGRYFISSEQREDGEARRPTRPRPDMERAAWVVTDYPEQYPQFPVSAYYFQPVSEQSFPAILAGERAGCLVIDAACEEDEQ